MVQIFSAKQVTKIDGLNILIIVNGAMDDYVSYRPVVAASGYIICVDGGTNHAFRMGLRPDLIVGDLDSIDTEVKGYYERQGCVFQKFPAEKDESDLQLALAAAAARQPSLITIIGALGRRFDHAFGNVVLLSKLCDRGIAAEIVDATHTVRVFDRELTVTGQAGDLLSLFSLTPRAEGVTTTALKYPLRSETLYAGDTRGLSNELLGATAKVTVASGKLLAIHVKR